MADNRRFPGGGLPRDAAVDTDDSGDVGDFKSYGNQFMHDESTGPDKPFGPPETNSTGAHPVRTTAG